MNKVNRFSFFSGRFASLTFLLFSLLICVVSYLWRVCHFDDPWFAEQMYFLAQEGVVRSELKRGFLDWDQKLYVFHKLHIYIGAVFIKIFGFSLWSVKSLSVVYLLCFLGDLFLRVKK